MGIPKINESAQSDDVDLAQLKLFNQFNDELTVNSDASVILRGNRIVVPASLQKKALALAHEGHQGIVKTKKLLREKVWFPKIEEMAKQMIDDCIACQANGPESRLNLYRCHHCLKNHGIQYT